MAPPRRESLKHSSQRAMTRTDLRIGQGQGFFEKSGGRNRVESEGIRTIAGRIGSGQEVMNLSRIGVGRARRCSKCRRPGRIGSGRVESGRVWLGRVEPGVFKISRLGPGHPAPTITARSDLANKKPGFDSGKSPTVAVTS